MSDATLTDALFAIVLAAGGSERLGQPKQLVQHEGRPLVRRALDAAAAVCGPRVLLVLGCHWQRVLQAAGPLPGFFTVNPRWREGLSASLRLGVRALPEDCRAVLVALSDQPLVDAGDLVRLADAWHAAPALIAASRYGGGAGVPAIFPAACFGELAQIRGDRGAKALIERHGPEVTLVDCEHAELDIDEAADLTRLDATERD